MLKNKLKNYMAKHEDGFTIIEVIIVLVIGAVIMLAVFLVVPQLQRSQRNATRQNDARRVLTAAEQIAANNNGTYSSITDTTLTSVAGTIVNPQNRTNMNYNVVNTSPTAPPAIGTIDVVIGRNCNGSLGNTAANSGNVAVIMPQETPTATTTSVCYSL